MTAGPTRGIVANIKPPGSAGVGLDANPAGPEDLRPIIRLAHRIIEDAYFAQASHIHIQPEEKVIIVRFRIAGTCHVKLMLPTKVGPVLVALLKSMSNLDPFEHRLPQEGHITFKQHSERKLDLTVFVSTAPLLYGEGVVLHLSK